MENLEPPALNPTPEIVEVPVTENSAVKEKNDGQKSVNSLISMLTQSSALIAKIGPPPGMGLPYEKRQTPYRKKPKRIPTVRLMPSVLFRFFFEL